MASGNAGPAQVDDLTINPNLVAVGVGTGEGANQNVFIGNNAGNQNSGQLL